MSLEVANRSTSVDASKGIWQDAAGLTPSAARTRRMRLLLLCSRYSLPYRVLRCAAQAGADVFAMGNGESRSLRLSRYCRGFMETSHAVNGRRNLRLAADINEAAARHGIDMILAAGHLATRSLVMLGDAVAARRFPLPEARHFETLNNKWSFTRHCLAQGVSCPESWLFSSTRELRRWLARDQLPLPLVAKPLDRDGGRGVCHLDGAWASALDQLDYAPLIVQRRIEGEDIGAAAYVRAGRIESFLAHRYAKGVYEAFPDPGIRESIDRLLRPLATNGVFNFDMRRDAAGRVHFLECNPRFFFKIGLAMRAGLNFVEAGLGTTLISAGPRAPVTVRRPAAALLYALRAGRLSREDMAFGAHLWADPLPFLRETFRLDWDE
jgi:predicted ATP-grasp superfamily ATP-dependent carboligase